MARHCRERGGSRLRAWAAVLVAAVALLGAACSAPDDGDGAVQGDGDRTTLRVLFAGSLIIPFDRLEKEFEAAHPDIDVYMEGHGSIQAVRIVGDLHEQADVIITADYRLIPMLLYQVDDPRTGEPYAHWSIMFATNKMTMAYTPTSVFADEVDGGNWFEVINREGVRLGISDPRIDANGYRGLMTIKLAEDFYDRPDLFSQTFGGVFRVPVRATETAAGTLITVPEVLETKSGSHVILRPFSVNLLPLIKSGDLDYAFEYESVVKQHGLQYVTLPPEINLGDDAYAGVYDDVTVKLDFQRFASVEPGFFGEPIRYGATIPSNTRDAGAAETLLAFLLGSEGQRIMSENYQPMIMPASTDDFDALPESLKIFCTPGD